MKDNISNIFNINNKSLIINKSQKFENLYLYNDDFCFNCELEENIINFEEFILLNEFMILPNNDFYFGTMDNNGKITPIEFSDHVNKTICSKLKIESSKHNYYINIYCDNRGILSTSIERITVETKPLEIHSIFLEDNKLNLTVSIPTGENITEAGIVLFNKECKLISFPVDSATGNNAVFKIDLNKLSSDDNLIFKSNLILNGKIHCLNIESAFFNASSVLSKEGIFHSINILSDEHGVLTFIKDTDVYLYADLDEFYLKESKLTLTGNITSNLNLLDKDLFDVRLKFSEYEISLPSIEYDDNSFKFELSLPELNNLRNLFDSNLEMKLCVIGKENNKEYKHNISCFESSLNVTEYMLQPDSTTIPINMFALDNKACLNVSNPFLVKRIEQINIKNNRLDLYVKTLDSIYDTNFKLSMVVNDIKLNCTRIKKLDNHTFVFTFKDENLLSSDKINNIINSLIEYGSVITTSIKHRDYSQVISNTENVTVTNNKSIPCFSKYKQACIKIYNKIFYKTTKELTQRNENEKEN